MKPIEITAEDLKERDEYCSVDRFRELLKKTTFEELVAKDPILFMRHALGLKPYVWQFKVLKAYISGKRRLVVCCSRQVGKEQPLSALLLTPSGYIKMGDVAVGTTLIGSDGTPCLVKQRFPQGVKDVYKITFTDGSSVECGLDHLWKTKQYTKDWKVFSLREIIDKQGYTPNSDNAFRIPLVQPITFQEQEHIISPYVLGCLLGDGDLTQTTPLFTNDDREIIERIEKELLSKFKCVPIKDSKYGYLLSQGKGNQGVSSILNSEIKRLGLKDKNSYTKFIPKEYLFDSVKNRTDLLRGLMDTDGSIYGNMTMEFSTTSPYLKEDIKFLVESLGGNVRIKERVGSYTKKGIKKNTTKNYRVYVRIQDINPFSVKRKAIKFHNIKYKKHRIIKSIELVRKEQSQCILVNSADNTYLTNNCTVTHNSKYFVAPLELWRVAFNKAWDFNPTYRNKDKYTFDCIVSKTDEQATDLLEEIKNLVFIGDNYMSRYKDNKGKALFGERYFSNKFNMKKFNSSRISSRKGINNSLRESSIKSLPPTDKIRGGTYTGLIMDEVAFIDEYIIGSVAFPANKAIGDTRILISTPDKPSGTFYEALDPDERKEVHSYERFMFDIDCIKLDDPEYWQTVMVDIEDDINNGRLNKVNREYYCSFVSSTTQYFPQDRVNECFDPTLNKTSKYIGLPCVVGIDLGGMNKSRTVVTVSTMPDDNGISRRLNAMQYEAKKDGNLINDIENYILPNYNVKELWVDDCPAGIITIQNMKDKGWNIKTFNFNKTSKPDYMDRFRKLLSRGRILTYNDSLLKEEFANFTDDMKPNRGFTDDNIMSWMLSTIPFMDQNTPFTCRIIGTTGREEEEQNYETAIRMAEKLISDKTESYTSGLTRVI